MDYLVPTGIHPGSIVAVNHVNAQGLGDPALVSYRVGVNLPEGVEYFDDVKPRKPRPNIWILAARVGDPVTVFEFPSPTSEADARIYLEFKIDEAGLFDECEQGGGDFNAWPDDMPFPQPGGS